MVKVNKKGSFKCFGCYKACELKTRLCPDVIKCSLSSCKWEEIK